MPRKKADAPDHGSALAKRYTFRIHVLSTLISRITELSIGQKLDLSVPQWRILIYLHGFAQGGVREIARFHHYTDSQVSRAVQELVSRGLLERLEAGNDRRVAATQLTPLGRKVVEQGLPVALERNQRLADAVEPADKAAFERALDAITRQAHAMVAEMQAQEMSNDHAAIDRTAVHPARSRRAPGAATQE